VPRWLDPIREALDRDRFPAALFFRNDDVGWEDERLLPLLDLFAARSLPLDLAVIPAALADAAAQMLADRCAASGGRLRVHQHGWRHANHESAGRKCEFGPTRSKEDQAADLRAGRDRLQPALGQFADPIFTPPWNRCTQATADMLAAASFRVLSRDAGATPLEGGRLIELPVSVDWDRAVRRNGYAGLGKALAAGPASHRPVGVMLHHAALDAAALTELAALLDLLAHHDNARCLTMMACADLRER